MNWFLGYSLGITQKTAQYPSLTAPLPHNIIQTHSNHFCVTQILNIENIYAKSTNKILKNPINSYWINFVNIFFINSKNTSTIIRQQNNREFSRKSYSSKLIKTPKEKKTLSIIFHLTKSNLSVSFTLHRTLWINAISNPHYKEDMETKKNKK